MNFAISSTNNNSHSTHKIVKFLLNQCTEFGILRNPFLSTKTYIYIWYIYNYIHLRCHLLLVPFSQWSFYNIFRERLESADTARYSKPGLSNLLPLLLCCDITGCAPLNINTYTVLVVVNAACNII